MAKHTPTKQQTIVAQYLDTFPEAATKTLARLAYKEHPKLWPNLGACRCAVRRARGNHGVQNRQRITDKSHYRPNGSNDKPFELLPEGITNIDNWEIVTIPKPAGRWLNIADLHIPYHDKGVLQLILEAHRNVDGVIISGDLMDCHGVSPWERDPEERDFAHELEVGRMVLEFIRDWWPTQRIIFQMGNHDEWLERYLSCKAPELLGVADFRIESLLRCKGLNIQVVTDRKPLRLGKLHILHGHEYRFQISNPVNPARGLFLRGKVSAMCAHFHQTSQHSETRLDGKVTSCWSIGCACDLHPRFMPLNKWNHGFATVNIDEKGGFHIGNYRIIEGEIWS